MLRLDGPIGKLSTVTMVWPLKDSLYENRHAVYHYQRKEYSVRRHLTQSL